MGSTYLVTGGAGFIGSHIAESLLQDGQRVRIIDNLLTGKRENLAHLGALDGDFEFAIGDINDGDLLRRLMRDVDFVLHQAALPSVPRSLADPLETHLHCLTGTLNMLVAARDCGVKRVVYAASSSAYGDQPGAAKHESMRPDPISPYGVAKLAGEYYAAAFTHSYGLETVALRYFNVFGPRQDPLSEYAAVIPKFITLMLDGKRPRIYGDGEQSRDFTYIDNVVRGNLLACAAPDAAGATINLAAGGRVTLNDLVEQLNAALHTDLPPIHSDERPGDIKHSRADVSKAKELLGFAPVVEFAEGLRRTVDWYRERKV